MMSGTRSAAHPGAGSVLDACTCASLTPWLRRGMSCQRDACPGTAGGSSPPCRRKAGGPAAQCRRHHQESLVQCAREEPFRRLRSGQALVALLRMAITELSF